MDASQPMLSTSEVFQEAGAPYMVTYITGYSIIDRIWYYYQERGEVGGGALGHGALQPGEVGGDEGREGGGAEELLPLSLGEPAQQLAQGRRLSGAQGLEGGLLVGLDVVLDQGGGVVLVSQEPWKLDEQFNK